MTKLIIIGGGGGGVAAAKAARAADANVEITLICGEGQAVYPYYRTRICELLANLTPEKLLVNSIPWYTNNRIQILFTTVSKLDPINTTLQTADGETLIYDSLILALGSSGNILPVTGNNKQGVMAFRTLADIEKAQKTTGPAVIIGGGVLGLEAAWYLSKSGRKVTVVEHNPDLLGRQLDPEGSAFFKSRVEQAGIGLLFNADLQAIEGETPNFSLKMKDGQTLEAGLVVFAAGVKPRTELAQEAGLTLNRGIVVNDKMETSQPGIYAVGDCAEFQGAPGGQWTVAQAQGQTAAKNAMGGRDSYKPLPPSFLINAMGTKIWSGGDIKAAESYTPAQAGEGNFCKLFFSEDILVGACLIGDTSKQISLKKALDNRVSKEEALSLLA